MLAVNDTKTQFALLRTFVSPGGFLTLSMDDKASNILVMGKADVQTFPADDPRWKDFTAFIVAQLVRAYEVAHPGECVYVVHTDP